MPVLPGRFPLGPGVGDPRTRAWTRDVQRRLDEDFIPMYNLKDPRYNVKANGVTSDSNAFNMALTDAGDAGGGVVYAPPTLYGYVLNEDVLMDQPNVTLVLGAGTYTIQAFNRIYVTGADCTIRGEGIGATYIDYTGNTSAFTAPIRVEAARCHISDLKIEGGTQAAASNSSCISVATGSTDCLIERVHLVAGARGISCGQTGLTVRDSKIELARHSGIQYTTGASKAWVSGCEIIDCNQDQGLNSGGIRIDGNSSGSTDSDFMFSQNYFKDNWYNHVAVLNGSDNTVARVLNVGAVGNTFMACPAPTGEAGESITATCSGLRVVGNHFQDSHNEAVNWTAPDNQNLSGCIIAGNYVQDASSGTMTLSAINGSAFECVAGGASSVVENFAITGNVIVDTRSLASTRAGVSLRQANSGAILRNGIVRGNVASNTTLGLMVEVTEADALHVPNNNDFGSGGFPDRVTVHNPTRTAGAADTSPSVGNISVLVTGTSTLTINDFDDGVPGQRLDVVSKGIIGFDTTGTNLVGSSVDIQTNNGDTTTWFTEDGITWRLTGFVDASADNSGGA